MALPTRGQRDWDDELNNEIQRLDSDVQGAVADSASAKADAAYAKAKADEAVADVATVTDSYATQAQASASDAAAAKAGADNAQLAAEAARDAASGSATAAASSASDAAASAAAASAPTDARVASLVEDSASATATALSATFVPQEDMTREDATAPNVAGDNVRIGKYAAYPDGNYAANVVMGGAVGRENVIGGNLANVGTATSNLTGATAMTGVNGSWTALLGGYDNVSRGWAVVMTGMHCKVLDDANHVTISGGSYHIADAAVAYSTIAGGTYNHLTDTLATISGGARNSADNIATVGGGQDNTASGQGSTVVGGQRNTASGLSSTVAGGQDNVASGTTALVGGGRNNTAVGLGAIVLGGAQNTAQVGAAYGVVTGRDAVARQYGEQAHAAIAFAAAGDAQAVRSVWKVQTTTATTGYLADPNAVRPVIGENMSWSFRCLVVAREPATGDTAAWTVTGAMKRGAGNTAALVGTPTVTKTAADTNAAAWALAVTSNTDGRLNFGVTGEAGKTIRWVGTLEASQVAG